MRNTSDMAPEGPSWPAGGEIDIIEGINLQPTNMIALHTSGNTSCTIPTTFTPSFSGRVSYPNCDNSQNFGSGCTVYDPNPNSYGQAFAETGGGVFVAEFAEDGIRVWFMTVSLPFCLFLLPPRKVKMEVAYGYHSGLLYHPLSESTPHRSIRRLLVSPWLNTRLAPAT